MSDARHDLTTHLLGTLRDPQKWYYAAVKWLLSPGNRGEGRTYLMAVAYVILAMENPNIEIRMRDHFGALGADSFIIQRVASILADLGEPIREKFHLRSHILIYDDTVRVQPTVPGQSLPPIISQETLDEIVRVSQEAQRQRQQNGYTYVEQLHAQLRQAELERVREMLMTEAQNEQRRRRGEVSPESEYPRREDQARRAGRPDPGIPRSTTGRELGEEQAGERRDGGPTPQTGSTAPN